MNNLWIVSDTHFNHDAIIKYCHRPLDHEELQWKALHLLPRDSILLHLGDVSMGNDEKTHESLNSFSVAKKRWLIRGNHDTKSNEWYMKHGWDFVADTISMRFMGHKIVFSHRPIPVKDDEINIHGHLHNLDRDILKSYPDEYVPTDDRHILISPELNNYQPVKLATLLKGRKK